MRRNLRTVALIVASIGLAAGARVAMDLKPQPALCVRIDEAWRWTSARGDDRLAHALERVHASQCPSEHEHCRCRLVPYQGSEGY